ncbi:MAG: ABC transporter permease, partial [Oscillospiraceae bacterium]|nr:ABC transporter permease [Oscillospiraceae bacterium]
MKAIYKRELRSFFSTMTGYVFTAIVVLFVAFNFSSVNLTSGYPYFAAALSGTLLIFILAVPILTMRSFADERRSKTEQLLMSYPVTTTSVVLGKYLAMLTVYAIPLLISCL